MDGVQEYLDHPALIGTGAFPETVRTLCFHGLEQSALDVVFLNLLRLHFLIEPTMYVSKDIGFSVYVFFTMLESC